MRSSVLRALRSALVLSAGGTVLACAPLVHAETVLYDRGDQVQRLLAVGPPGLTPADDLIQQQPARRALPGTRQAWKVSGGAGTRATPSIVGLRATRITEILKDRIARSGGHMVFLDELGPAFKGRLGDELGQALRALQKETTPYAPDGLNLRVHLYVGSPGQLLADDKSWTGARRAMSLAGGVWLEAYHGRDQWTAEEWVTWPGEVAREMDSIGGERKRVHVLLRGGGDHAQTWRLARTGSACAVLGTGPGAYRLGEDAARFVAEFRRTFPAPGSGPAGCTPAAPLPAAAARAVVSAVAREQTGVELPPGAIGTPSPAGRIGRAGDRPPGRRPPRAGRRPGHPPRPDVDGRARPASRRGAGLLGDRPGRGRRQRADRLPPHRPGTGVAVAGDARLGRQPRRGRAGGHAGRASGGRRPARARRARPGGARHLGHRRRAHPGGRGAGDTPPVVVPPA